MNESGPAACNNLIGATFRAGSGTALRVRSPHTGELLALVRESETVDVESAISAAAQAFATWRSVPIRERVEPLQRFRALLTEHADRVAATISSESGKTTSEARAGLQRGLEVVDFSISLPNVESGSTLEVSRGVTCEVRREPLGITLGITPFNFPAMVPMWMFPIAIATGNVFILKPSEKVPLTAGHLGELLLEAGLPPGVFQIVHGGRRTAELLAAHPRVAAVAFVGSTPAARAVYQIATREGKRALCLGGAKNHLIVAPDADPELTTRAVVDSFTGCAGQRCMAASVMIAIGTAGSLVSRIASAVRNIELGTQMGALIDRNALDRLTQAIGQAEEQGAKVLVDGRTKSPPAGCERGFWLGPTVLDQVRPDMSCAQDELFGPVLSVIRVETLEQALELEQSSPYGNATSVFTRSGSVARLVAERATSGMIGVNVGVPVPRDPFSFGGTKSSKFGQGDITGRGGVEFWTNLKKITTKWAPQQDSTWMS